MVSADKHSGHDPESNVNNGALSSRQFARWVYGLAAVLIVFSCGSLTLIAHFAWRAADRHALETAQMRFLDTVEDQYWEIARRQMAVVQDPLFAEMLSEPANRQAALTGLTERPARSFALDHAYLLDEDNTLVPLNTRHKEAALHSDQNLQSIAGLAVAAFRFPWVLPDIGPYSHIPPPAAVLDASVAVFAVVNDKPALLSALPIDPELPLTAQPPALPRLLVHVLFLDTPWLQSMSEHYGFHDLIFVKGTPARPHPTQLMVYGADGNQLGYFKWDHSKPGLKVWVRAFPLIVLLAVLISLISAVIARKIGRLYATLEHSERRNHYFARHDNLTGLPNRHQFSDRLAYAIDSLPQNAFAVIACDLDTFKPINDSYGHEAGDTVLRATAARLQTVLGETGVACRIGGDEFVLLITLVKNTAELTSIAKAILQAVAKPIEITPGTEVTIGISLGIAVAPECGSDQTHLIRAADMALYQAKDNGRNTYRFATSRKTEHPASNEQFSGQKHPPLT